MDLEDTHVDPARLLEFHAVMLSRDQDEERSLSSTRVRWLEVLLTERVVACWILVETFEVLMTAQLALDGKHRVSVAYLKHMIKWQESANRRYLSSIRELARVRKLQSNTPSVQLNIQNNVLSGGSEAGKKDARERDPRNAL